MRFMNIAAEKLNVVTPLEVLTSEVSVSLERAWEKGSEDGQWVSGPMPVDEAVRRIEHALMTDGLTDMERVCYVAALLWESNQSAWTQLGPEAAARGKELFTDAELIRAHVALLPWPAYCTYTIAAVAGISVDFEVDGDANVSLDRVRFHAWYWNEANRRSAPVWKRAVWRWLPPRLR